MVKNLKRFRKQLEREAGKVEAAKCDFFPKTFEMPCEYHLFVEEFRKNPGITWIMKPVRTSAGRVGGGAGRGLGVPGTIPPVPLRFHAKETTLSWNCSIAGVLSKLPDWGAWCGAFPPHPHPLASVPIEIPGTWQESSLTGLSGLLDQTLGES